MSSSKQSSVKSLPFLAIQPRNVPSPAGSPVLPHSPIPPDSPAHPRPHNPIILKPETPRQLLIPQFDRPLAQLTEVHHSVKAKHHKLIRHHKSHSRELLSAVPFPPLQDPAPSSLFPSFRVIQDSKRITGFRCHAVEKWLVERDLVAHPLTTVTALTNDEKDAVNVAVIAPPLSLSPAAAEEELQHVIYQLKRTGARPHETPDGVIMITSFNSFRGDLNLIPIPDGDCDAYRCQLFTNINLARMGCGGRSAPTLDPAPDATQDKFLAMYAIPPSAAALVGFNNIVLEFIHLVQAALAIFGFFPVEASERDGLLCDLTVKGMQRWVQGIGEPYFRLEPMEGVLEPSAVVALLSLVAAFRWRMYSLGASSIPRDPFYDPEAALSALVSFQKSRGEQPVPYLTYTLIEQINAAHAKALKSEHYKVHKAIMHRPEDCEVETMNIDVFVRGIVSSGKDGIESLRLVWTGKARKERKKDREEDKETEGEGDDVSEHIGRILRKGAGNVHALASGVVDGVKDGVKELGGLTRSRKGTDPLPTFKITHSDPEPDMEMPRAARSGRSSLLALPSASSSMSELDRSKRFMFPSAKAGSIKSFKTVLTSGSVGASEVRPALRRTRTDAREVFMERDEDELSPAACSGLVGHDLFEMAASTRNCKRRSSFNDVSTLKEEDIMPIERMHTDVDLCGQFLQLRDREAKMRHAITIAEVTLAAIQRTNTHLDRELIAHKQALAVLVPRAANLHNQARAYMADADELSKNSQMLEYQLDRLEEGVKDMSRTVAGGRKRVRALRGEARKVGGVHGIEEDSASDEDVATGVNDKIASRLRLQSISGIQRQFGSWLGAARSRS